MNNTIYNWKKSYVARNRKQILSPNGSHLARSADAVQKLNEQTFNDMTKWINVKKASEYSGLRISDIVEMETFMDVHEYSLIYSEMGCYLLKNRYLQKLGIFIEPIKYMYLRLTLYMRPSNLEIAKNYYLGFATGLFLVSSVINQASIDTLASGNLHVGDACKLVCPSPNNDVNTVATLFDAMKNCILGSGIGVCGSALNLNPIQETARNRTHLDVVAQAMSSCLKIKLFDRQPQMAIYVAIHCESLFNFLQYKSVQQGKLYFMVGIMIPDYFVEKFKKQEDWHFFNAEVRFKNKCLHEYYGSEYVEAYDCLVAQKKYTSSLPAVQIMQKLIESIKTSGQPYIIWSDKVNEYNNNKFMGAIKTLNLCAEITNATIDDKFTSCILMSCSPFYFHQFPHIIDHLYRWCVKFLQDILIVDDKTFAKFNLNNNSLRKSFIRAVFVQGCMGTIYLSSILNLDDKLRQIGLSPVGIFDCSVLLNIDVAECCTIFSEVLYLSALLTSMTIARKLPNTAVSRLNEYSKGLPQFALRKETPILDVWSKIIDLLKENPISNSLLTTQAPTSTTANLMDVCESVQIPIMRKFTSQQNSKRIVKIPLGFLHAELNGQTLDYNYNVEKQLLIYKETAKYIDHSQSTIYHVNCTDDDIKNVIVKSYNYNLKTGIYYIIFKGFSKSIKAEEETCTTCSL